MMRVKLRELIRFYDEDKQAHTHASAIKAVAGEELNLSALIHYFKSEGVIAELRDNPCTTKQLQGSRLDAWLYVSSDTNPFYYQVEVKSWSFHGAGGREPLSVDCTAEIASAHCKKTWKKYWDDKAGTLLQPSARKVLTPMQCPDQNAEIRPLLCLWEAVHPEGDQEEPFFSFKLPSGDFDYLYVFSTSNYMRKLLRNKIDIDLDLPKTSARIAHLSSLFIDPK